MLLLVECSPRANNRVTFHSHPSDQPSVSGKTSLAGGVHLTGTAKPAFDQIEQSQTSRVTIRDVVS